MKELSEAIKNKAFGVFDVSKSIPVNRKVVYLKDVLAVFADFQKNHARKTEDARGRVHVYPTKNGETP